MSIRSQSLLAGFTIMSPPPPSDPQAAALNWGAAPAGAPGLVQVPASARFWMKLIAFSGPGYLIAVGYMDPGNWATDIAGGAKFGYALLPAIVFSNFAAMFLQWLALRLGIASGRDLAQACRAHYSPAVARSLWVTCEIAIVACDLAEVIGTAIALKLLFHLPILLGVCLTAFDTLIVMGLLKYGFRYIEAFTIALTAVVGLCFAYELAASHPDAAGILGSFLPSKQTLTDPSALYLAVGIFGATVMPHNLYLHSSIAQSRKIEPTVSGKRQAIRFSTIDCFTALTFALLINLAILVLAAAVFHWSGHANLESIEDAYKLLSPTMGVGIASVVFAVALLAAGQNSTLTGTMAGQIVMEGFLGLKMNPFARRLLTRGLAILPALAVTAIAGDNGTTQLLILSQVVLSLQLGFAVVPLVRFTSDAKVMGLFVNGLWVRRSGYAVAAAIILVNGWLVVQTVFA
ncbi:MAG TPA: Nramp family divalent metal transporter [Rhizomicrobium sp.]